MTRNWQPVLRENMRWPSGTENILFWRDQNDTKFVAALYQKPHGGRAPFVALWELETFGALEHEGVKISVEELPPHPEV